MENHIEKIYSFLINKEWIKTNIVDKLNYALSMREI